MCQSRLLMLAAVAFLGGSAVAHAGPCTTQIAEVQRRIQQIAPGSESGPTAAQSVGAQLHHQPTPGSVESAENKAREAADAALDRARNADAAGDATRCAQALHEAKELYGLE